MIHCAGLVHTCVGRERVSFFTGKGGGKGRRLLSTWWEHYEVGQILSFNAIAEVEDT